MDLIPNNTVEWLAAATALISGAKYVVWPPAGVLATTALLLCVAGAGLIIAASRAGVL